MSNRWAAFVAACVACAGCAAIVGLSEPGDVPDGGDFDAGSVDAAPSVDAPPPDAGTPVDIGFGSGRDGPLVINDRRPINDYAPLAKRADVGARTLTLGRRDSTVSMQPIRAGDVLLVVQTATPGVIADYDKSPLDSTTGTWELASVVAVNGDDVDIAAPLAHAFSVPGTQVVRVVQPTTVEIGMNGALTGPRWDGVTGGIVAVIAKESIVVNGTVDANGLGFRGARGEKIASPLGCTGPDGLVDAGFAPRGEGFGNADAGFGGIAGGRGNPGNGGGGGDCHNAGGGGGGNGGRGAIGGNSFDNARNVGGIGGAALTIPPGTARLRFGGGGGAGEQNEGSSGGGGAGGGVVFIRTPKLTGTGNIVARGSGGGSTTLDGAGGGGAGGTVYLDVTDPPTCGRLGVTGGGGGNCGNSAGPGGGGAGGLVFIRGGANATGACIVELQAGAAGKDTTSSTVRGAGPPDDMRTTPPFTGLISADLAP